MMIYAIKRKDYDFPYRMSCKQNTAFYETYDGCRKAIDYEINFFKRIHNEDVSKEYEILGLTIDLSSFGKVSADIISPILEAFSITPEIIQKSLIEKQIKIIMNIDDSSFMGLRGKK